MLRIDRRRMKGPSAYRQEGKLATFDRKIPAAAVRGGVGGMEIIPA
jgi:hypothetical protein